MLEYGDVGPKLGQLQGMAAVAGLDNEALQSAVRDRIQGDKELQGIVNLHKLIQKEIAASTDSVKDLVTKLLPAAELAGKDRAWLEARLQAVAAEQDSSRSSPQAASHRTSKHVAGSPDADLGKRRILPAAVAAVAVVAVSVVGLWFWAGVSDDGGQFWSGDRTETTALRPDEAGITLAELTSGNSIFQVATNEPGVTVLLDGVELGRTPLSREDLRPGSYTLSLQSPYYVDREVAVTLADGVVFKEDYVLQVSTGQLTVLSEPAGAAVYIDGQDTGGVTPVTLNDVATGTRALSLRLVGYQTMAAQTVTVEEEQNTRLVLELELIEPGETFRDSLADGGEGPLMVVLPAGSFSMGCLSNDSDCYDREQPVHDVTLPNNLAMAVYEVTFAEYDRYVQATGVRRPDDDEGWGRGDRPVINVYWEEARAYARWLSEQTGHSYRLPTDAEWEYAARAGTTTKYSWGNVASHEQANYGAEECCSGLAQGSDRWEYTAPVGSFPANGFGLYDMHGNVYEWTQDCLHDSYRGAPTNGQAWEGANGGDCDRRVMRGGSWFSGPGDLRAAYRGSRVSLRYSNLGLRLVQDLP